ncbi:MAG TPA: hybrid sensor histidine kinase/response regulator [Acidobacteriaceae bacterium]|jgi:signal transduction histidine kinase|nr:hybrid sensor histidine kinase/response regulator [Acidobacteriaceae bacterium]
MTGESIPGILMLRCSALSHHAVRAAAHQAGLRLVVDFAENRREFLEELRRGTTDLIVAGPEGLPDLELREVFNRAGSSQPPIPVVLAGGRIGQNEAIRILRNGAAEVIQSGEMERLPTALARALKVRQSAVAQSHAQEELDRTAVLLRENQKLITIGRLAASIAHEINNPLESITNLLYLLGEERELSPSSRSYLALAQKELGRVGQISRQTLNFSRETTGPVRAKIDELLEEVLSLYSRRMMEKNLRVERQYDCPEEALVYPGEMRQVLSNLITNAVEASSPNGRLRVRVRCMRSWSDTKIRGIRISVGDNGSGIPLDVQRRLGQPFFTTKGQRGTGLGLWVTRAIVQRYGGEMQLRSSVHPSRHGTVFSIFLPTNLRPRVVELPAPHSEDRGDARKDQTQGNSEVVAFRPPAAHGLRRVNGAS